MKPPTDSTVVTPRDPTAWRAWAALVGLSWRRQVRARQMVWTALVLLGFAVVLVAIAQARGRFSLQHRVYPRPAGWSYRQWVDHLSVLSAMLRRPPAAPAGELAFLGATRVVMAPTVLDARGQETTIAGFQVFSQAVVFAWFLSFLLPMWSLSFATEAIGGERESGSLLWLLSRPLSRPAIYLAKFVALLPWTLGLNLGGFALLCLLAGTAGRLALTLYWPAIFWASLTFASLFLLMGTTFRRPAVVAILYSFCLEVVLGNMPGFLKRVSVGYYARCLMYEQAGSRGVQPDKPGVFLPVDGTTATLVLAGAAVALLLAGMWIFSRTEYHEID